MSATTHRGVDRPKLREQPGQRRKGKHVRPIARGDVGVRVGLKEESRDSAGRHRSARQDRGELPLSAAARSVCGWKLHRVRALQHHQAMGE